MFKALNFYFRVTLVKFCKLLPTEMLEIMQNNKVSQVHIAFQ